jgi:predicted nucleic acid-binding protein
VFTLDSSGLFAILNRRDPDRDRARAALSAAKRPYLVPAGILCEAACLIEHRLRLDVLEAFLSDMEIGGYTLECGERDLGRIRALVRRYADLPLGFADAAVIACAERNGGRALTFDLRHFAVVAREGRLTILPE